MTIQEQVSRVVDYRIQRICRHEWAKQTNRGKKKRKAPVVYPSEINNLVGYMSELVDCTQERAEEIYSIVTNGEIKSKFNEVITC